MTKTNTTKTNTTLEEKTVAGQNIKEREYWHKKLGGPPLKSCFPADFANTGTTPEPPRGTQRQYAKFTFQLTGTLSKELVKTSSAMDQMLHIILTAGLQLLLYKYDHKRSGEIQVGAPIYKQHTGGNLINRLLILKNTIGKKMTFKELLMQVRQTVMEALAHQNYPMGALTQQLHGETAGPGSLFDVAVLLENIHARSYILPAAPTMIFLFQRTKEAITCEVEYDKTKYTQKNIESITTRYVTVMEHAFRDLDIRLDKLDILLEEERKQILEEFNATKAHYPGDQTLYGLFRQQAERSPETIAATGEEPVSPEEGAKKRKVALSYRELDEKSDYLAGILRRKGLTPETPVGLLMEPSVHTVTSLMGILKAGGSYLPIDPVLPAARVRHMLADSNAGFLISDHKEAFEYLPETEIAITPPAVHIAGFNSLSMPDRSLIDLRKYKNQIGMASIPNAISLQATRGCPYKCIYCHKVWSKNHVFRSADNIFEEVLYYYNKGVRKFAFIDDCFNLNIKNSKRFFQMVLKHKLDIRIFFPNGLRGDIMTPDYIELMTEAGTRGINLSLETASPRLQKLLKKNLDIDKFREVMEYIAAKHPEVVLEIATMHGFPTETEEEAHQTLNFIKSIKWLHFPYIHILKIFPNTEMEEMALEHGISKESILKSKDLAFHELPETLPFPKSFTRQYQADFMHDYFLLEERLRHVLPVQLDVLSEPALVEKYNAYLPAEISSLEDVLSFTRLEDLEPLNRQDPDKWEVPELFETEPPKREPGPGAKKILLLDVTMHFSSHSMLYNVSEQPVGLLYLLTYAKEKFGDAIDGRIYKTGVDFDSFDELKTLVEEYPPDLVGIRCLTFYKDLFHETVSMLRQWGIEAPIIAGGPYASSDYPTILKSKHVALAVMGEGETIFTELLEKMLANGFKIPGSDVLRTIDGIAYPEQAKRSGCEIIRIHHVMAAHKPGTATTQQPQLNAPAGTSQQTGKPTGTDLAYILYTSGSTGKPKGVMVEQRQVINCITWMQRIFALDPHHQVVQRTPLTFDPSVWEVFWPLAVGACTHILPEGPRKDAALLIDLLVKNKELTVMYCTATLVTAIAAFLEANPPSGPLKLPYFLTGAEPIAMETVKTIYKYLEGEFVNTYGPTEGTINNTWYAFPRDDKRTVVPIGKPVDNNRIHIVSNDMQAMPIGQIGEICIAGDSLVRGYLNDPTKTEAAFVNDPFVLSPPPSALSQALTSIQPKKGEPPVSRLYHTGDLGRWLPDGNIEILGRMDVQLKVRGYRIEPGEIETLLLKQHTVDECVVLAANASQWREEVKTCRICGINTRYNVEVHDDSICLHCHNLGSYKEDFELYFKNLDDLKELILKKNEGHDSKYDCLMLYNGGRSAGYAIYQLVEMGIRVLAVTYDNGYFSKKDIENIKRTLKSIGVDHDIVTHPATDPVLKRSIEKSHTVCRGCFHISSSLAPDYAMRHNIKVTLGVTLSRGQIIQNKLLPFLGGKYDDLEDLEAKIAELTGSAKVIDKDIFEMIDIQSVMTGEVKKHVTSLDFYRYCDITNPEMLAYLDDRDPYWQTKMTSAIYSTNCPIKKLGDFGVIRETDTHFYGGATSWEKRLGHITLKNLEEDLSCSIVDKQYEGFLKRFNLRLGPGVAEETNENFIAAYIVSRSGDIDVAQLREDLGRELPEYMMPSYFSIIEEIPVTPNGKVDRKALPDPRIGVAREAFIAPEDGVQQTLAEIWTEILGIEKIGIDDNFFQVGGDSIKAIQISAKLVPQKMKLEIKDLFSNPTMRQLGGLVEQVGTDVPEAQQDAVSGEAVPTPIQHWFFRTTPKHIANHFNQSIILYRKAGFDPALIERLLTAITTHHDGLRMVYPEPASGSTRRTPFNRGIEEPLFHLETIDFKMSEAIQGSPEEQAEEIEKAAERIQASIDITKGPLLKAGLFKTGSGDHLLIVIHHLAVDGVSWRIIMEDLETGFSQALQGEEITFTAKTNSFLKWTLKQQEYAESDELLAQLPYWRQVEETELPALPTDWEPGQNEIITDGIAVEGEAPELKRRFKEAETTTITLSKEDTNALLTDVNRPFSTEINDILLAGLAIALWDWADLETALINLEGHGRETISSEITIARTVGWFTAAYPVLLDIRSSKTLSAVIKGIKETMRRIPQKGIAYGILRYMTPPEKKGNVEFHLEPAINFNYLGQFETKQGEDDGDIRYSDMSPGSNLHPELETHHALDISGMTTDGELTLSIRYNPAEFKRENIEKLANAYHGGLREIIRYCITQKEKQLTPSDLDFNQLPVQRLEELEQEFAKEGRHIQNIYSLSPMQEGMLFHAQMEESSGAYFEQMTLTVSGKLDPQQVEETYRRLTETHDVLRTVLLHKGVDRPAQILLKSLASVVQVRDITHMGKEEAAHFVEEFKKEDRDTGFQLTSGPLMRMALLKPAQETWKIVWSFHHILMDGWCFSILFKDFIEIYQALQEGKEPEKQPVVPYIRYIRWLEKQDKARGLEYWQNYLEGYEQPTAINGYVEEQEPGAYESAEASAQLDAGITSTLNRLAAQHQVTVSSLLQAAWGILLMNYNSSGDVVFGAVTAGRPPEIEGIENIVGLFINTVPIRIKSDGKTTFPQLISSVHESSIEGRAYEYLPLAEIQACTPVKDRLIGHLFGFENFPVQASIEEGEKETETGTAELTVTTVETHEQTNYDFNIVIAPGSDGLKVEIMYNARVYDPVFIERLTHHYKRVLESVTADPNGDIHEIDILSPQEKKRLLVEFNDTGQPYEKEHTIHDRVEQLALQTPANIALVGSHHPVPSPGTQQDNGWDAINTVPAAGPETKLTYKELNETANLWAHKLRGLGVGAGTIAAIKTERSVEMVFALLAVLKTGGAYLPLDPASPQARRSHMLEDSGADYLLTYSHLETDPQYKGTKIYIAEQLANESKESPENQYPAGSATNNGDKPGPVTSPGEPAYIIYTSGTTGRPKGVVVPHQGIANLNLLFKEKFNVTPKDRVLQFANLVFDASVWEITMALLNGASLYIASKELIGSYHVMENYLTKNKVTIATLPPEYALHLNPARITGLRMLITAGSATPPDLVRRWQNQVQYINAYGPTETTVCATYQQLAPTNLQQPQNTFAKQYRGARVSLTLALGEPPESTRRVLEEPPAAPAVIPIGKPLPNTDILLLSPTGQLVPVGIAGEICIAGDGVALGYLNRPELTAEKFVNYTVEAASFHGQPEPIHYRLYRTGDLARWLENGAVQFLGRIDQQVKIRGFRIEPAEIEEVLRRREEVADVAVIDRKDTEGSVYLCAYIVSKEQVDVETTRNYLALHLPDYMVPSYFVEMEKLPLSTAGKIDRRALPDPLVQGRGLPAQETEAPADAKEARLIEIWRDILKIDTVSVHDNFFSIGGHSLKATMLTARIQKEMEVEIPLTEIFQSPTVRQLAAVIKQKGLKTAYEAIRPAEPRPHFPLSAAQKRLYTLYRMQVDQIGTAYNMPTVVRIEGALNRQALQDAFKKLIQRHESLRTSFHIEEGEPVQKVHGKIQFALGYVTIDGGGHLRLSEGPPGALRGVARVSSEGQGGAHPGPPFRGDGYAAEVDSFIEEFIRPFELEQAPLLRAVLVRQSSLDYILMVDMHHVVSDGISMEIIVNDVMRLYGGEELPGLRLQYRDYALWQQDYLASGKLLEQQEFWKREFADEAPVLALPYDYPRPAVQRFEGDTVALTIEMEIAAQLREMAAADNATLFMVVLGLYSILLSLYSGQEDIVVGTSTAGRPHTDLEPIVGMFVNTLALRNQPVGEKAFSSEGGYLRHVSERTLAAFENQDFQFEELVELLDLRRDFGRNPLFDTMLSFQKVEPAKETVEELVITPYRKQENVSKFDLMLTAVDNTDEIVLSFQYSTQLFKKKTIEKMVRHFENILQQVTLEPMNPLHKIDILTPDEKEQLVKEFNDTDCQYPAEKTLDQLFLEQAERTPENKAVTYPLETCDSKTLTYRELAGHAGQLAQQLEQKGAGPETIVGIILEPSIEMVIAILGTLIAGGAYMPIDPTYPEDRKTYMLKDTDTPILITNEKTWQNRETTTQIINIPPLSGDPRAACPWPSESPRRAPGGHKPATNTAYIIYTSGTTGRPKGVMVEHRDVVRLMINDKFQFDLRNDDVWTIFHSFCFDFSVWEMYGALLYGGNAVIVPKVISRDTAAFHQLLISEGVTILNQTPSAFYLLMQEELKQVERALKMRYIILAAEALKPARLKEWKEAYPGTRLINMYGITETTVFVTYKEIEAAEIESGSASIGTTIPTLSTYVMDRWQRLVPVGTPAEICVGGLGVARGYVNQPELTAAKFLETSPVSQRLYLSGDLARWLPDGELEYLGRIDQQVKIRGFRIELGEIENCLLTHPAVGSAVVMAGTTGEDRYLCAYIVPAGEATAQEELTELLRNHAAVRLPGYMIPAYFVYLEIIPLTPNGKVNKRALPVPEAISTVPYEAPRNRQQERLRRIWARVLEIENEKIGIKDNFFRMGGHSLKATMLAARIHKELFTRIPLQEIFRNPTIEGMALYIKNAVRTDYSAIQPAQPQESYPLSSAQKRLFTLSGFDIEETAASTAYNIPAVLAVKGELNKQRLEQAIKTLIQRHETLRTSFHMQAGEPVQKIQKEVQFAVGCLRRLSEGPPVALRGLSEGQGGAHLGTPSKGDCDTASVDALIEEFIRPFELSQAPLLRVELVETGGTGITGVEGAEYLLMMDMHHIISDGTSMEIITKEFLALYEGKELPELAVQYKDYAVWQQQMFESGQIEMQAEYWKQVFSTPAPVLELAGDYPRPPVQGFEGAGISFKIDRQQLEGLRQIAEQQGATLFMVLLAAYSLLLTRLSGEEDTVVGIPTAGRPHPDLEGIIGMFVNTLAIRNYPKGNLPFAVKSHKWESNGDISVTATHRRGSKVDPTLALGEPPAALGSKLNETLAESTGYMERVREVVLEAFDNQDYQFEELVDQLEITRDISRSPLFDTMFTLQNMQTQETEAESLKFEPLKFENTAAKFDLVLSAKEGSEEIQFGLQYSTAIYKRETMVRLGRHYQTLLQQVIEKPEQRLQEIEILGEEEKRQLTEEFNKGGRGYQGTQALHRIFEQQVERTPEAIAAGMPAGENREAISITYDQLNRKANKLTRRLQQQGMGEGTITALMLERSLEILVALLAVLKAGGAYMPLDPQFPATRIHLMLADSGAGLLVTQKALKGKTDFKGDIIFMEDPADESNETNLETEVGTGSPAYIIYTSGTTGIPKGTLVKHQNVERVVRGTNYINIENKDVLLQLSNYAFDGSVFDIYGAMLNGARLVMVPAETVLETHRLSAMIKEEGVTVFFATAALFNALVEIDLESLAGVRKIVFGGERASVVHVERAFERLGAGRLINGYGPTETAVFATYYPVDTIDKGLGTVPIGYPLTGTRLTIVDKYNRLQPVGIPGELCISGGCVAEGYLNRPELTAEKFEKSLIVNVPGETTPTVMYRTGDVCRWLADGTVEFIDRIDSQVKIRGFRIEPGEIEVELTTYAPVRKAFVMDYQDADGTAYLCAYVEVEGEVKTEQLREHLLAGLPAYMVPAYFIILEKLPINPITGKVDRKALPKPEAEGHDEYVEPDDETGKQIVGIWQRLLGIDKVGKYDDFFKMGGNSLKALRMVAAIREQFGIEVPVMQVFSHPTVEELSSYIRGDYRGVMESEVVGLNREQGPVVFCMPPGVGYGIIYKELAALFSGVKFYGFNFIESDDRIDRYVEQITRIQPGGPYILLGWSAGGNLAFEVAKGLELVGDRVSKVILLDAHRLRPEEKPDDFEAFYSNIEKRLEEMDLVEMREQVLQKTKSYLEYWRGLESGGVVEAELHVLRARIEQETTSDLNDWGSGTSSAFKLHEASGLHKDMLVTPHMEENAEIIKKILEE